MKKYWLVFKISVQDIFEYRLDFFLHTFKYALALLLTALVWIKVATETNQSGFDKSYIVIYYSLAAIVFSLSSFHTWYIEDDIKLGQLSKYLVKPISAFWNYFFHESAAAIVETLIKLIVVLPIVFIMMKKTTFDPQSLILTAVFLPFIFFFTFNLYCLISQLAFWVQEIHAFRWSVVALVRLQAGFFVPISFFPASYQAVSFYFPFQHLAHTPIQLFTNQLDVQTALKALGILMAWTLVVIACRKLIWKMGTRFYEGTGI